MFFYLRKILLSSFLKVKDNFVRGQCTAQTAVTVLLKLAAAAATATITATTKSASLGTQLAQVRTTRCINLPSTSVSSSAVFCEGSLHLKGPRFLTEWMPTNGVRPNARLSLTRMLIGGEYRSSTGRF